MFKVFREGVLNSTHFEFGEACKRARIQAGKDRLGTFTVFEVDEIGVHHQRYQVLFRCSQVHGFPLTLAKLD